MSTDQNYRTLGSGDLTLDAWGQQIVANRFSLFHGLFTFDIPPTLFRVEVDDVEGDVLSSSRVSSVDGALNIDTDGTSGQVVILESRRHPRYQPNRSHSYSASIGIDNPTEAAVQDFGLFTKTNGVFFRCKTDGELYACVMSGGVLTHEELITLPDEFPDDFDISKGQNYDIQFQWRGVGNFYFYIQNPKTGCSKIVHKIDLLGVLSTVSMENPALPIAYRVVSFGDPGLMWSGCCDITSSGGNADRQQYGEYSNNRTVTAGGSNMVLALRNPNLAPSGEINTRDLILARVSITAGAKATFKTYLTRDETAIAGGAWAAVKPGSFVEANTTATSADITKMQEFSTFRVAANLPLIKDNPSKDLIDFVGIHGDIIVIVITSGNNINADAGVEWGIEI